MKALLLAAGRGERMGVLTDDCPKPLLTVGGRRLIEHRLASLAEGGVEEVVINLGYRGDMIRDALGQSAFGMRLRYAEEGFPTLDTGGAIANALPLLG